MRYRLYYLVGKLSNAIPISIRYVQVKLCFVEFLKHADVAYSFRVRGRADPTKGVVMAPIWRKLFRGLLERYIIDKPGGMC